MTKRKENKIIDALVRALGKIEDVKSLKAIRNGMIMLVPALLSGAIALVLKSLPIPAFKNFIETVFDGTLYLIINFIYDASYNLIALLALISISFKYAKELKEDNAPIQIMSSVTSVAAYIALFGFDLGSFNISYFNATGVFGAIIVSLITTRVFITLYNFMTKRSKNYLTTDLGFKTAVNCVLPFFIVVTIFAVINVVISKGFKAGNFNELIIKLLTGVFSNNERSLGSGILFEFLNHFLWFLGIHGDNTLESVAINLLKPGIEINAALVAAGLEPTEIVTKTFLDNFVLMGGSGVAVCICIATFIAAKKRANRRLIASASPMALFNVNELIIFGMPIVFNFTLFIPFIVTPVLLTITSYLAMKWGIVPIPVSDVEWTTPVLISGYAATGSIAGSLLQLFNIALGTLIYIPFIRLHEKEQNNVEERGLQQTVDLLKAAEESGTEEKLLNRRDDIGNTAKMLAEELDYDISKNNITMYFQPQMNNDGVYTGSEALLRWGTHEDQFIYPPLIIEIAKEANLMNKLTLEILRKSLAANKQMNENAKNKTTVSVNVSASQLQNPSFVAEMIKLIKSAEIDPSTVGIEITEDVALVDTPETTEAIDKLKNLGIILEIDDFSIGHTAITYLRNNKFDVVKLDGALVRDIENERSRRIIRSITELGKELNFKVIAEYVETQKAKDILQELGCDLHQGYLYSPAIPVDELEKKYKK